MVSKSVFQFSGPTLFPERGEYEFAFRFWCCEPSVKNQWGGEMRGLILLSLLLLLECFNFQRLGGGSLGQRVLFRAG